MTPILCCGFECGGVHFSVVGAGTTISTSITRSGSRSLRCNPSAAQAYAQMVGASTTASVARVYIYFASLPTASTGLCGLYVGSDGWPGAFFNASDSKIYAGSKPEELGSSGVSVTTGVWYLVDVSVNVGANPWIANVSVNSIPCGQRSKSVAASSGNIHYIGTIDLVNADVYADDWMVSVTSGDYPIGPGYVRAFVPTSDGTHNIAGTGDFQRGNSGTDILNGTTTAYQLVDDVPLPSGAVDEADNWRAVAPPNATDYVEAVFGPVSGVAPMNPPRAVDVVLAHHQIATQSGNIRVALNDNATINDVINLTGAGVTTYRYASKHYALAPTGGAWTVSSGAGNFNNLRTRFYSSDAAPDQCLDAIMIEAEFDYVGSPRKLFTNQAVRRASVI